MARNISYDEFRAELTDEELAIFLKGAKKRRLIYFFVYLALFAVFALLTYVRGANWLAIVSYVVAVVMGIFAGFGCWANNIVRFVKSQGRKNGGIVSILWCLFGGVLIPLLVIFICGRASAYKTVLGWDADKAAAASQRRYQDGSDGRLLIDALLDPNNTDPITLVGDNGRVISFKQIAIIPYYVDGEKTMFVLLQPIDKVEGIADDEMVVFRAIPQDDGDVKLLAEPDEQIANAVYKKFQEM